MLLEGRHLARRPISGDAEGPLELTARGRVVLRQCCQTCAAAAPAPCWSFRAGLRRRSVLGIPAVDGRPARFNAVAIDPNVVR
jgi:hypothetical protein